MTSKILLLTIVVTCAACDPPVGDECFDSAQPIGFPDGEWSTDNLLDPRGVSDSSPTPTPATATITAEAVVITYTTNDGRTWQLTFNVGEELP